MFTDQNIKDIDNLIDFIKGLVIKDEEEALKNETAMSLKNSGEYISAIKGWNEDTTEYEKKYIQMNYIESNKYYKYLSDVYGIDIIEARFAKDFKILKATINTLDKDEKNIFYDCYNSALLYHNKVTMTKAFKNQQFNRAFNEFLLFLMTVQRYLDKKMENFFNIDSYTKDQLKNAFISNGLDYFDSFPINYQRRTLKKLNDLIRQKGTDNAFKDILDIFSFDNIDIYKYILVKSNIIGEDEYGENYKKLYFYKCPYDEKINLTDNRSIDYYSITSNDPYWRSTESEIIKEDFNTVNSKYLSVDISMDLLKNTYQLAYFFSLLNNLECIDHSKIMSIIGNRDDLTYEDVEKAVTIKDYDMNFLNRNISNESISIYDAFIALVSLVLKLNGFKDKINTSMSSINSVYGYGNIDDNIDVNEILKEIRNLIFRKGKYLNNNEKDELLDFINTFRLKSFKLKYDIGFESISDKIKSNHEYVESLYKFIGDIYICAQQYLSAESKTKYRDMYDYYMKLYQIFSDYFDKKDWYNFIHYALNLAINGNLKFDVCLNYSKNPKFIELLKNYYGIQVIDNEINQDLVLKLMVDNKFNLYNEMTSYIHSMNNNHQILVKKEIFDNNQTYNNLYVLLNEIIKQMNDNKNEIEGYIEYISTYKKFHSYLNLFMSYDEFTNEKVSMEEFVEVFKYNENMRNKLEDFVNNTQSYELYNKLNRIWDIKFVSDFNTECFKDYSYYSDYLRDRNPSLYLYVTEFNDEAGDPLQFEDRFNLIKDRIFELCESLDNHISTGNMDFLYNNNFINILEFIKKYIYVLVRVFKAYTIETIYANTNYQINNRRDSSIRLFDDINNFNTSMSFNDFMHIHEFYRFRSKLNLEELMTDIKLTEDARFYRTFTDGSAVTKTLIVEDDTNVPRHQSERGDFKIIYGSRFRNEQET